VRLENINALVSQKIFLFGVGRGKYFKLLTMIEYTADNVFLENASVVIFQDNQVGFLNLKMSKQGIDKGVLFSRIQIGCLLIIQPYHLLVPADDTGFRGGGTIIRLLNQFRI